MPTRAYELSSMHHGVERRKCRYVHIAAYRIEVDARPHSTSYMILSLHTLRINDLVDNQWTNGRA